nr:hypothetical protein CFP56_54373 [Quercus suber]
MNVTSHILARKETVNADGQRVLEDVIWIKASAIMQSEFREDCHAGAHISFKSRTETLFDTLLFTPGHVSVRTTSNLSFLHSLGQIDTWKHFPRS